MLKINFMKYQNKHEFIYSHNTVISDKIWHQRAETSKMSEINKQELFILLVRKLLRVKIDSLVPH